MIKIQRNWVQPMMTWATFAGLLQTDGSFGYLIEPQGTFKPSIIFSQSENQSSLITSVCNFLQNYNIKFQIEKTDFVCFFLIYLPTIPFKPTRATNIRICRIENCEQVIKQLDLLEENNRPIFMGGKLKDYLLFKEAFLANKNRRTPSLADSARKTLVDIKMVFNQLRPAPATNTNLSRQELEKRVKITVPNASSGAAKTIVDLIDAKITNFEDDLKQQMKDGTLNITNNVGQFVAGCIDGDGSFQINALTHLGDPKRTPFEFKPAITLTNVIEEKDTILYQLLTYAFLGANKATKVVRVGKGINADRYLCNSISELKLIVPFFDRFPLTLERKHLRFEALKEALGLVGDQHKSRETAKELLDIIYDNPDLFDPAVRKRTKDDLLKIIDNYFDNK